MANPEHLAILKQGVERWNNWRDEHPYVRINLSGADLRGGNLRGTVSKGHRLGRGVDLSRADLRGAQLRKADLARSNLNGASLSGADLSVANLTFADLGSADLREADLRWARFVSPIVSNADLSGADFRGTVLRAPSLDGAILTGGRLDQTVFVDVDLSAAKGLETVVHMGPSTIGIDTLYKSRGKIPEVFLRGCGVPEEFIAYIGSMVGRPIEYYSCFISYSTKDQGFADRLYADLQSKGVRCWFAPHDIKGGRKIHEQIDEAIRVHDKLLLILSEHSMASEWVKTELGKALKREKQEDKRVLFPVRVVPYDVLRDWELIGSSGQNLSEEIRQYFIPDFSEWARNHGAYQREFEKLVGDLKAG